MKTMIITHAISKLPGGTVFRSEYLPKARLIAILAAVLLVAAVPALAQDPWTTTIQALQTDIQGPIAKGLAIIAIVIGGLMFAFGEGSGKKMMAGIIFGIGLAISAANVITWLFPNAGS